MTKHAILTETEYSEYSLNDILILYIENYRLHNKLERNQINILDWGCGRGLSVLWLKEQGYNAFGVDIDKEPIYNGLELMRIKGYGSNILSEISPEGKTIFQSGYFHIIFSNQVLEHVENVVKVAQETSRITRIDGLGIHIYPDLKRIIEGHLKMPMVHWSPKSNLRKFLIYIYVLIGIEPNWPELKNESKKIKANLYYLYSINKTFYRRPSSIKRAFIGSGFSASFIAINNPRIVKYNLIIELMKFKPIKQMLAWLLLTIKDQVLLVTKK